MSDNSSPLTLVVFKDGLNSRSFKVTPASLTRLSAAAGLLVLLLATSSVLALRYFRVSRQGDPARQQLLRDELEALQVAYDSLKAQKSSTVTQPVIAPAAAPAQSAANPAAPSMPAADGGFLFRALPSRVVPPQGDTAAVPIQPASPRAQWQGNTLKVRFDLQYTGPEKGYQQGRIVILARGPNTILAYPPNLMSLSGNSTLIDPDKGEYFSVSRFREVRADFGPVPSRSDLEEVEVIIFDQNAHVLLYRVLKPQAGTSSSPKKSSSSEKTSSDEPLQNSAAPGASSPAQGLTPQKIESTQPEL